MLQLALTIKIPIVISNILINSSILLLPKNELNYFKTNIHALIFVTLFIISI